MLKYVLDYTQGITNLVDLVRDWDPICCEKCWYYVHGTFEEIKWDRIKSNRIKYLTALPYPHVLSFGFSTRKRNKN